MSLMSQARADLIKFAASLSSEVLVSRASIPGHLYDLIDERMGIPFDQRHKDTIYTAGDAYSYLMPHIFEEARELALLGSIVLRRTESHRPGQIILFEEIPPLVSDFMFDIITEAGHPNVGYRTEDVAKALRDMLAR